MGAIQNNDRYIGQLLVKDGIINDEELEQGLEEQKRSRDYLCSTLVRLGLATEEKVFSILSLQIGVPYLGLKDTQVDPLALRRMPGKLAKAFNCLLLRISEDVAYLAMTDPMNAKAIDEIRSYLGVTRVKTFLSGDQDIALALHKYYEPTE
jgi:hypothetical protein